MSQSDADFVLKSLWRSGLHHKHHKPHVQLPNLHSIAVPMLNLFAILFNFRPEQEVRDIDEKEIYRFGNAI